MLQQGMGQIFALHSVQGITMHCTAVTHGHLDHVGALPLLLKLYPDMKVVIHEAEGPYLQGLKKYFSKDGLSLQMRALHFLKVVPGTEFQVTQYSALPDGPHACCLPLLRPPLESNYATD